MAAPTLEARAHSGPSYTTLLDSTRESSPALVRQFDDASVGTTSLVPAERSELTDSEARAYELAIIHGRPHVAEQMLEMFGVFECPNCHSRDRNSAALA